jgi:hypothetical protein
MTTPPKQPTALFSTMSPAAWGAVAAGLLALALILHAMFPRYEWRAFESSGSISLVVYDRWAGRFQRATYDDKGGLNVMGPYVPQ